MVRRWPGWLGAAALCVGCSSGNPVPGCQSPDDCSPPSCGNGVLDSGETCDDGVLNGTYEHCPADCAGAPRQCGDGVVDPEESCDEGASNGAYGHCPATCVGAPSRCGDGVVDAPDEVCEPGAGDPCHACNLDCSGFGLTSVCGDHAVCADTEDCDDGADNSDVALDACRTTCMYPGCGDGFTEGAEQCDPGDPRDADPGPSFRSPALTCADLGFDHGTIGRCNADCTLDVSDCWKCGDGIASGPEQCDGADLRSATCETLGFPGVSGGPACTTGCTYDVVPCGGCNSCRECAGQACVDGRCTSCVTDADCCAPYACLSGRCSFI